MGRDSAADSAPGGADELPLVVEFTSKADDWPELVPPGAEFDYERFDPLATDGSYSGRPLRKWQQRALGAWEDADRTGVIEAITGTGKSLVGIAAIRQVVAIGGTALVLVPTRSLLEQWWKGIREVLPGIRVGRLNGDQKDGFDQFDVLVATVQTAYRDPPRPHSLGLLIADEAHRYGSVKYAQALSEDFTQRMALSGTYERQGDLQGTLLLDHYFGDVVYSYGYEEALREEVVAPFHLALVGVEFTVAERQRYDSASKKCEDARLSLTRHYNYSQDWLEFFNAVSATAASKSSWRGEEEQLCSSYLSGFSERRDVTATASAKEKLVAQLASAFADLSGTLVFTETKASAKRLAQSISPGASAIALTSDSSQDEREQALRRFGRGEVNVLCAPRILDEGIDVPEAELAVVVAASQTRRQMVQRMGRVIRLKKNEGAARILMLYVKGSPEDWSTGGHQAFLDEVVPFASTAFDFGPDLIGDIQEWMSDNQLLAQPNSESQDPPSN